MFDLPLFPLNVVLFPGLPLKFHIFEARYIKLINHCVQRDVPFGVVLIKHGKEALGPLAEPHPVGCTAQIVQVEHLDEGRMNIATIGRDRFRIISLDRGGDFLVGSVEPFPLEGEKDPALQASARLLRPWVKNYLRVLSQTSETRLDTRYLPDAPVSLAYLAAYMVRIPLADKQNILETGDAGTLLNTLEKIFRREIALLKAMLKTQGRKGANRRGASLN